MRSPESVCRRRRRQKRRTAQGPSGEERDRWGFEKNSLRVCVSARLNQARLARLRDPPGLLWSRLCLTYAVAMTQRLVNACSTRCLGLANARLLANSGLAAFLAMPKVVRAREAVGRLTVVALVVGGRAATAIHTHGAHQTQKTRKVGRLAEGRGAKSRTLVSTRPSMSSCSALWQIWHRSGGGGVNVQRGGF